METLPSVAMKPYQRISIAECHEPLVTLDHQTFCLVDPHPYAKLGAPYGDRSPFSVRQGVRDRLIQAQQCLQQLKPGWRLQIFDAYRPIAVQQFMVDYTLQEVLAKQGWAIASLTDAQRTEALQQVYQFWAMPNPNPLTPPPHSTGAAIDLTLVDETGQVIDMGSAIDEISPRSYPDHYVGLPDASAERYDTHRQLLNYVMRQAGFQRHYHEWWHFSWGDQLWAWLSQREDPSRHVVACYGRVPDAA
ncbi:M15 family metallopeptidase [Alkalinema sp. FACHB-956]|uniref:M15 family metallopeptidase n=1 Tax=Alkalinema sp. FACHB-956 TaxID=2692768 RepID=UPI003220A005